MTIPTITDEPTRATVDAWTGPMLLEFGSASCGWCRAAQAPIAAALADVPAVRHVRIEDGRGRRLGRSFGVTLWPTLVALRDGVEVGREVRPADTAVIAALLASLR